MHLDLSDRGVDLPEVVLGINLVHTQDLSDRGVDLPEVVLGINLSTHRT